MARTYYAEILGEFDWERFVRDMDAAEAQLKEWFAESPLSKDDPSFFDYEVDRGAAHIHFDHQGPCWMASVYLGSVLSLTPSGKFYAPWTTNQTADDVDRDSRWFAALDKVCERFGLFQFRGEGDPTDLYVGRAVE